jgi:hypothetical protein
MPQTGSLKGESRYRKNLKEVGMKATFFNNSVS